MRTEYASARDPDSDKFWLKIRKVGQRPPNRVFCVSSVIFEPCVRFDAYDTSSTNT